MLVSHFHEHLKSWRLAQGMTQGDLAGKSGIPRPNIVALEQGRRDCTVTTLRRLASALGVSPGTVIDREPPGHSSRGLGRHEIDRIARSLLFPDSDLPPALEPIRRKAGFQAEPLLKVAGIRTRPRTSSRIAPGEKRIVDQVLKRVSKLLPSVIERTDS